MIEIRKKVLNKERRLYSDASIRVRSRRLLKSAVLHDRQQWTHSGRLLAFKKLTLLLLEVVGRFKFSISKYMRNSIGKGLVSPLVEVSLDAQCV